MTPDEVHKCHLIFKLWDSCPEHRKTIEVLCKHIPYEARLYMTWLVHRWRHIRSSADSLPQVPSSIGVVPCEFVDFHGF